MRVRVPSSASKFLLVCSLFCNLQNIELHVYLKNGPRTHFWAGQSKFEGPRAQNFGADEGTRTLMNQYSEETIYIVIANTDSSKRYKFLRQKIFFDLLQILVEKYEQQTSSNHFSFQLRLPLN